MISRLFAVLLVCFSVAAAAEDRPPKDPRTLFNLGAELAASEKLDEATEVLLQAAVVRDRTISAKALSLIGQIAAAHAKQTIPENPAETSPEQRRTIFDHLKSAEQSFVESLSLQPNEEVRQYLETLRAWRHNMTNVWDEYDREQQRNRELQQRIQWLADGEETLTEKVRPLLDEPNSPRKYQTGYESGREQKQLADELGLLRDIPVNDEEIKEKWEMLPEIQKIADEAAELLTKHRAEEALPKQQQVLDYLRSLLKQEQNQDQQNQEQNDQDQQTQEQQSPQQEQQPNDPSRENEERKSEMNQPQTGSQEEEGGREESPEERAERLLMQVRRKEQAAKELRDQIKALLMQADPVTKDW